MTRTSIRYHALATDYDETLATANVVPSAVLDGLRRIRASGRRVVLVTGRGLDDLLHLCPEIELFDRVVAENGAVLYRPATREELLLGEAPGAAFVDLLRRKGVTPLSTGRVIVATREPHEARAVEAIRELGLELQVIFNKGAVMILPSGINKASGLRLALDELNVSPRNVVGIGDAENDHAFLRVCECGVAVADAIQTLRTRADVVTGSPNGSGVLEIIEKLLSRDLDDFDEALARHDVTLGMLEDTRTLSLRPYAAPMLIAGSAGAGNAATAALLERIAEREYQYCLVAPEGRCPARERSVILGDARREPSLDEVIEHLERPAQNVALSLVALAPAERSAYVDAFVERCSELRMRTGRPHWLLIEEAHLVLSATPPGTARSLLPRMEGVVLITGEPGRVAADALRSVALILALGEEPGVVLQRVAEATGRVVPPIASSLTRGEGLVWQPDADSPPSRIRLPDPRAKRGT